MGDLRFGRRIVELDAGLGGQAAGRALDAASQAQDSFPIVSAQADAHLAAIDSDDHRGSAQGGAVEGVAERLCHAFGE